MSKLAAEIRYSQSELAYTVPKLKVERVRFEARINLIKRETDKLKKLSDNGSIDDKDGLESAITLYEANLLDAIACKDHFDVEIKKYEKAIADTSALPDSQAKNLFLEYLAGDSIRTLKGVNNTRRTYQEVVDKLRELSNYWIEAAS